MQSNAEFCKNQVKKHILVVTLSALGLLLQFFAGSWDTTSHLIKTPETFFTLPHIMLYTGIGFTIIAFVLAINFEKSLVMITRAEYRNKVEVEENHKKEEENRKLQRIKLSLRLLITDTIILISGAPLDFI